MNFRKVFVKRIRRREGGAQIAADVNAAVSANVGERRSSTHVSSKQSAHVVQRSDQRESRDEAKEAESE